MTELRENKWTMVWLAISMSLLVALGGVTLGWLGQSSASHASHQATTASQQAKDAATQAKQISTCINDILGVRGQLSNQDSDAYIEIFTELQTVLLAKPTDQPALYAAFLRSLHTDVALLTAHKAFRVAHPLGHC